MLLEALLILLSAAPIAAGFLYFGAVGDTDFNYDEMQELDRTLHELGVLYRFEVFPGPHDWMPEAVATRALEWMALHSSPPADLVEASWNRDVGRARELEAAGRLQEAWRLWSWISRDYADRRDTTEARARAAALATSDTRKAAEKAERKRRERERAAIERAQQKIALARASNEPTTLPLLLSELQIPDWQRRAREEGEVGLSAQRVLNSIQSQVAFYLPRDASQRGAYAEAALYLTVASEIRPEDPQVWYRLAAAQARAGRAKNALATLGRALDAGFSDRARLEGDADLASLRRDPGFPPLLARLP